MDRVTSIEKIKIEKQAQRVKLIRTGKVTTLALGLACCANNVYTSRLTSTGTTESKIHIQTKTKHHSNYLYSMYENDRLDQKIKVFGFKNTTDQVSDKWHFINEIPELTNQLIAVNVVKERARIMMRRKYTSVQQKNGYKENTGESDQVGSKQTEDIQKTSAVEEKDEKFNQEQPNQENRLNKYGKVVYVEQNRFAIETATGDKWFVVNDKKKINMLKPNIAVSIYFHELDGKNCVTDLFITHKP
ncbi:hypothetical protein [Shouchella lehensis]|uniref:Uncharacterized protein n=1 Tax=Shouchella lehensis TaxID=300825 RepID=A0A4Y7WL63_9BACI|nr:hypothetical protein [Shouchella lehensis]MBG9783288.1 hypothetical protein [Shouchella lehensis]TES49335.1 hypothetical protein E2L03_07635 [Shouchella lehensis]